MKKGVNYVPLEITSELPKELRDNLLFDKTEY